MLYGYMTDTALQLKKTISVGNEIDTGYGYLNDRLVNHFKTPIWMGDSRSNRLTVLAHNLKGGVTLVFDQTKNIDDLAAVQDLSTLAYHQLFNIAEYITFVQNKTDEDIDNYLFSDSDHFGIYVRQSVSRSAGVAELPIEVDSVNTAVSLHDWIQFEVNINLVYIKVKLWLNSNKFKTEYPLSTIDHIVLPAEPVYLLDNSKFSTKVDTLLKVNAYVQAEVDGTIRKEDQTSLLSYFTKYVLGSQSVVSIPFGVLYQGAVPTSLEIRAAIRDKLLGYGIADPATWETLFPDLFVTAQFFLVPMWGSKMIRVDRSYYPSVAKHAVLKSKTAEILPAIELPFLEDHLEMLTANYREFFITAIPDPLNITEAMSLLKIHPTYQFHSSQTPGFAHMDSWTQDFSRKLNQCLAVLTGDSELNIFVENKFYNRRYLSFVADRVEYHVLREEDYNYKS